MRVYSVSNISPRCGLQKRVSNKEEETLSITKMSNEMDTVSFKGSKKAENIAKAVVGGMGAFAGGVIGFAVGGPVGAAVGAAIGGGAGYEAQASEIEENKENEKKDPQDILDHWNFDNNDPYGDFNF